MSKFKKGSLVTWKWGQGEAEGKVEDVFTRRVKRRIKGKDITRKGSQARPAYLVKQADGAKALKLESELSKG